MKKIDSCLGKCIVQTNVYALIIKVFVYGPNCILGQIIITYL